MAKKQTKQTIQSTIPQTHDIEKKRIQSFLNNEVKDYAIYVIRSRAMPNIMDGLRTGARKIVYAGLTGELTKKVKVKMPSLIGDIFKLHYNHGDASLMNTVTNLSSKHIIKHNLFDVVGQIGSLRVPNCDTAPRYLHIKKNNNLTNFFGIDSELLNLHIDEGDVVEPHHFLPIVPFNLLWKINSPGYGFSYRSFSYTLDSVIDNCIQSINFGSCYTNLNQTKLIPTIEGIDQSNFIYNAARDCWYNVGSYQIKENEDICIVTDLPYNVTFEMYDKHLTKLIELGYIKTFTDLSLDSKIKYVIKFNSNRLKVLYANKWNFYKQLKLYSKIPKDTLNCIDENGKTILFFENGYELIDTFVQKRLKYYQKRKETTIIYLENLISKHEMTQKFIQYVIDDTIVINKRSISDIKNDLDLYKIKHDVLNLKISKFTSDDIQILTKKIIELKNQLDYITKTSIQEMYVKDLIELKQKYSEIKKVAA